MQFTYVFPVLVVVRCVGWVHRVSIMLHTLFAVGCVCMFLCVYERPSPDLAGLGLHYLPVEVGLGLHIGLLFPRAHMHMAEPQNDRGTRAPLLVRPSP